MAALALKLAASIPPTIAMLIAKCVQNPGLFLTAVVLAAVFKLVFIIKP